MRENMEEARKAGRVIKPRCSVTPGEREGRKVG